ncbi:NAD(P)-dependent alcohol dehydrogenase [Actinoplanes sp. DH11]|uniref:NAD(P)-dependent alcohol dehydrogenase n=1 Tax=Actinoplanes sp. DH11 TaxID=2857011 RepID=UPI001E5BD6E6|nr:NAD(P)-dependent alcohol dehydrogenase [Actinoplanes sp. DH11]
MKAVTAPQYGSITVTDLPAPTLTGTDDVLVEVHAAGLDPGVWIALHGRPYAARLGFGLRRPRQPVLGRALAGVVTATGPGVTRLRPGDRVYGTSSTGTFAEFTRTTERRLARMPANLTFEQAAAVPISAVTALKATETAGVRPQQHILVIGAAGGVGSFTVQLAVQAGATVTAVCGPSKATLARSLGATDTIDHTRQEITAAGIEYDAVIDTAGNRPLSVLRQATKPAGVIALVGGGHAQGLLLGGFGRQLAAPLISPFGRAHVRGVTADETHTSLDTLTAHLESGAVVPVVGRTYPLTSAEDAISYLAEGHTTGKTVLTVIPPR